MTIQNLSFAMLSGRAGRRPATLDNPVSGDRLTILQSVWRDGAPLTFRIDLPPGAAGSPLHVHARMDETFEVVAGELAVEIGGKGRRRTLRAGDRIAVPAGTPHSFRNASGDWTSFIATASRGVEFERFLLSMIALAAEGRTNAAGLPTHPLQLALLLEYADLTVVGVPPGLQRLIVGSLAKVARAMGVERRLARHWVNERAASRS